MPEIQFHQKKGILVWNGTDWVPAAANVDGELIVEATLGDVTIDGADGAITDGANATIKATVFDYVGSNPLAVTLVDAAGDQYDASGGSGGAVELEEQLDYDSGAGTVPVSVVGLALPGAGGPVAGGTSTNPIQVGDGGGSLTVDGTVAVTGVSTAANQATQTTALQLIDDIVLAEDAAHQTGDKGVMALAVRQDSQADFAADGDYVPLSVDADGGLRVTVLSGGGGGTQYTEDAAAAANPIGSALIMVREDARAGSLTTADGDNVAARGTDFGELYVKHVDAIPITDNAGSLTVDGTVSVTGVATAANQTTIIGHVDGIETLLTAIDGHVDGIEGTQASSVTALQLIDDIVYVDDADWTDDTSKHALVGGVYQASPHTVTDGDVAPFLTDVNGRLATTVTGTVTVGSHAVTNAGTFAVQVTSQVPGTGATNLGKAEDAAHSSGDVGVMALSVRQDTAAALGQTDADYQPLITDSTGRLHVNVGNTVTVGSHAVTNAGTFAVQVDGNALTALQLIDDPVVVLGTATYTEASSKGMLMGAVRRDADTTLVDTTNEFTPLQVDAAGKLKVEVFDGGDSHTVDNNGTFVVQENGAALTALQLIDDIVYTDDTSTHATGTSKGALMMAAAVPTDTSVSANDIGAVAMTTDRKLHVAVMDALPAGSAAIGKLAANSGVDIGDVDVTTVGTITPGTAASSLGKAEDAAHTTGDVGVMSLGVRSAAPSERSAGPTDGDYEPFATNEVGAVWVSVTPSANGGASTLNSTSSDGGTALTNGAQAIKASAGTLKGYYIYNPNATAQFVQFYNTASGSVTVGTTNPLFMLTIPATSAANMWMTDGIAFATAISWSATSTAGGNGAPASSLDAVAWYK